MQVERHQDFPNVWQAVLILGLLIGLQLLFAAAFYDAGARFQQGDPKFGGIITVLGCGVIFAILLSYKNLGYGNLFHPSTRSIGATLRPLLLPLLVITAGSVFLGIGLSNVLVSTFPMSRSEMEMFERMFSGGVISVIFLCIIAPFVEEMLFRGLFLRSFLRNYDRPKSILYAAILFGIAHLNLYQFVIATLFGLISGWVFVTTRSLWPSIIEHATYNGGVMLYYSLNQSNTTSGTSTSPPDSSAWLFLAGAILFLIGGLWLWRQTSVLDVNAP